MICPYCQNEMAKGYIQCRDDIVWSPKKSLFPTFSFFNEGATQLYNDPDLLSNAVVAHICRDCKKVIIDYDCI